MRMHQNNQQEKQYYDDFRYKSYDEIMQEKRRYRTMRRSMAFAAVFFVALSALMACVGILIGSAPLKLFDNLSQQLGLSQTAQGNLGDGNIQAMPGEGDNDFSISIQKPDADNGESLYAQDVSGVVEKTRNSVVGVTSESYDNYNTKTSCGSGIIISADGYIVTNYHVIEGANNITVTLDDGEQCMAYLIGYDAYSDLAVISVQQEGLPAAEFGDSDQVRVGEIAIAIGNPTGQLQGTATSGIISALNRNVEINNTVMNLIQTDAAINSGNSGGPLLNCYGQVIGINTMKVGAGTEGLGFAIPSVTVKEIVDQLISQGYVSGRPDLGVMVESLPFYYRQIWGLPACVYVTEVEEGSTAADVGIVSGDVILSVDGVQVTDANTLETILYGYSAGDTIELRVFRDQTTYRVTVTLKEAKN